MSMALSETKPREICYAPGGLRHDVVLLEVTEELLSTIEKEGVVIKGAPDDQAVLCTHDKTFAVKSVETTNLLLLIPPNKEADAGFAAAPSPDRDSSDIHAARDAGLQTQLRKAATAAHYPSLTATATATFHIELSEVSPRLSRLKALLGPPYGLADEQAGAGRVKGTAAEQDGGGDELMDDAAAAPGASSKSSSSSSRYPTTSELLGAVQASLEELLAGLAALRAVKMEDGRWKRVDDAYLGSLLELIMVSATEQGWPWEAVPATAMADLLESEGCNHTMVLHCLAVYSTSDLIHQLSQAAASLDSTLSSSCYEDTYCLDETKVCLHFARQLLRRQQQWRERDFLEAWQAAVPPPFKPHADILQGEVLVSREEAAGQEDSAMLRWFPADALPPEVEPRFAALFAAQPRWTREQLDPYIRSLQVRGQTVEALLLKHARASQPTPAHPVVFSAR